VFPYHDENQTQRTPYVTMALIAITTLVWVVAQGAGSAMGVARSVCELGLIPGELTLSVPPGTSFPMGEGVACLTDPGSQLSHLVTSMFLHGSWMHLLGNMWFMWLFGNNVEDSMTRPRFVAFYLLTGLAAALAQVVADPTSAVPMVGASGAISGVMGAYLVLFPRVRVYTLVPLGFFIQRIPLPAWVMFAIIFMWTPPHFWALAIVRMKDYEKAGVPMLPVVRGELETRRQILVYTIELIAVTLLLPIFNLAGAVYFVSALVLGLLLLYAAWSVWKVGGNRVAWRMYRWSSMYLAFIFIALVVDVLV